MKIFRKSPAPLGMRVACLALLAFGTLALTSCGVRYYKTPQYTFAGRPVPPSKLLERVLVSISSGQGTGALEILDGLRDIRNNVQNTIHTFSITGYSGAFPNLILNFPEQQRGYVYSDSDGSLQLINYSTEAGSGAAGTFPTRSSSIAVSTNFANIYSAEETVGQLVVLDNTLSASYALNLPGVYRVAVNQGNSVVLAMVRNSDTLYRVIRLNANQPAPPGNVDCQPYNLPVYCVVPVPGSFSRPIGAYYSVDGATAYVLNCGPECGGSGPASVTLIPQAALNYKNIPTSTPYPTPQTAIIPVPGGVTVSLSDGTTLYLAGQQLQPDGLFAGYLSTLDLASNAITGAYRISDGFHSRLLFADDNTLWIGSQACANGEHAKLGENYNCLTRFDLGARTAQIIPANVVPGSTDTTQQVPYQNENLNPYYYGDLTGICWVQTYHKVYTAYGGQVHAFNTADGSEINNYYITVQGTALDVAYMDAATNAAN